MSRWDDIIREHGPAAVTAAWRILGDAAQADAAAREVFRRVREVELIQEVRCWRTVFLRLAVGCALARLRGRSARQRRPDAAGRLRAALGCLPREEAAAFALRYFERLPMEQIADTLLLGEGAVILALGRARARLESMLGETETQRAGTPGAA